MKRTLDYDCIIEVDANWDKACASICDALSKEWDMNTKTAPPWEKALDTIRDTLNAHLGIGTKSTSLTSGLLASRRQGPSLYRTVLKAVPSCIQWRVTDIDGATCRVGMNFSLPRRLHVLIYQVIIALFLSCQCLDYLLMPYLERSIPHIAAYWVGAVLDVFILAMLVYWVHLSGTLLVQYMKATEHLFYSTIDSHCRIIDRTEMGTAFRRRYLLERV